MGVIRFGEFCFTPETQQLRRGEELVDASAKQLELLTHLIEHRDRVVRTEEIHQRLWPNVFVSDASLATAVRRLRSALGDDGRSQRFIRTYRGRGLRFVGQLATDGVATDTAERGDRSALASSAATPQSRAFIGREEILATLQQATDELGAGRGSAFFLSGEAGIGKTRVAEELRTYAEARGHRVLWGRCPEGGAATPYWPWTQALRGYTREKSADALRAELAGQVGDVALVLPELCQGHPADSGAAAAGRADAEPDEGAARHRTFAALVDFLGRIARESGLVLVLDDLHWADPASSLLFAAAAQDLRDRGVLLVTTSRTTEMLEPASAAALSEARSRSVAFDLEGFTAPEIGRFVEQTSGLALAPAAIQRLALQTAGNPFFLGELVQALGARGGRARLQGERPESVNDLVRRRLAQLDAACQRILTGLATIGQEAPLALIAGAVGAAPGEDLAPIVDGLQQARRAGILVASEGPASDPGYRFVHALIRETVYDELPAAERAQLHERVGNTLIALHGSAAPDVLPLLAHHFFEASVRGKPDRAIDFSLRAAEQADRVFAWEDAAAHYQRALGLLERSGADTASRRAETLGKLGRALDLAGQPAESIFHRAAALQRELGDRADFSRAVLDFPVHIGGLMAVDPIDEARRELDRRLDLIREALDGLSSSGETALRALLLARLALFDGRRSAPEISEGRARESIALARTTGDSALIALALQASVWSLWDQQSYGTLRASIDEAIERRSALDDRIGLLDALITRIMAATSWGDGEQAVADVRRYARLAKETHHPVHIWLASYLEAIQSLANGDLEAAEALILRSTGLAQRTGSSHCVESTLAIFGSLRREQGRVAEYVPHLASHASESAEDDDERRWLSGLVYTLAEAGESERARRHLADFGRVLDQIDMDDSRWAFPISLVADAASLLGDAAHADKFYRALLRWQGRNVFGPGITPHNGPFDLRLGRMALLCGRYDQAIQHLKASIELAERSGAALWATHSQAALVDALAARGTPSDRSHARKLAAQVCKAYSGRGMEHFTSRLPKA